jgi:DNA-binding LacI/PurR family transcriptional regulator
MDKFDHIKINPDLDATLAQQLKEQLTWLIVNEQLQAGDRLPAAHKLADRLGINLHTVHSAYQKMEAEGLVKIRRGLGTHVLPLDISLLSQGSAMLSSNTIGVILPSWSNPLYHTFLQGVEEIAEVDQTLLILCNTHDDPFAARRDFARLAAKGVDGILVASHNIHEILQSEVPLNSQMEALPFVTADWPNLQGYSVRIDLETAGYQATQHLLEHGHKKIGLITFDKDADNVLEINKGYQLALQEWGLAPDLSCIFRVPGFDIDAGAKGAQMLLDMKDPPTAIFTITDTMAMGVLKTIKKAGLSIPNDFALASFNDIPAAELVDPPLTTVAAPTLQMGREAMQMLQTLIEGEIPAQREIILRTSLVIRQSCGCCQ